MSRRAQLRAANERIVKKAAELRFASRVPLFCECDDPDCQQTFLISLDDYHQAVAGGGVLTVPDHPVDNAETGLQNTDYWVRHRRGNGDTRSFG